MYWSAVSNKPQWRRPTVVGEGGPVTLTTLQPSRPCICRQEGPTSLVFQRLLLLKVNMPPHLVITTLWRKEAVSCSSRHQAFIESRCPLLCSQKPGAIPTLRHSNSVYIFTPLSLISFLILTSLLHLPLGPWTGPVSLAFVGVFSFYLRKTCSLHRLQLHNQSRISWTVKITELLSYHFCTLRPTNSPQNYLQKRP